MEILEIDGMRFFHVKGDLQHVSYGLEPTAHVYQAMAGEKACFTRMFRLASTLGEIITLLGISHGAPVGALKELLEKNARQLRVHQEGIEIYRRAFCGVDPALISPIIRDTEAQVDKLLESVNPDAPRPKQ